MIISKVIIIPLLSTFIITIVTASASSLKSFQYKTAVPQSHLSCQEEAEKISLRFSTVTQTKVLEVSCDTKLVSAEDGRFYENYQIVLSYQAEREPAIFSIIIGEGIDGVPQDLIGIYNEYDQCLADGHDQAARFELYTGFHAISFYCQRGAYYAVESYVLRIDGIHSDSHSPPLSKLHAFPLSFRGKIDNGLKNEVREVIKVLGGRGVFEKNETIFYYNSTPINLKNESLAVFDNGNDCSMQLEEARKIASNLGSSNIILRCLRYKNLGSSIMEITRDFNSENEYYYFDRSSYSSMDECLQDREHAKERVFKRGYTPLGAICFSNKDKSVEMKLFKLLPKIKLGQ